MQKKFQLTTDNYYSREANLAYVSASQYKDFMGSTGRLGCEAAALARLRGEIEQEETIPLMVGKFVDSYFEGSLDRFIEEHPEVFSSRGASKGELKAPYKVAMTMVARAQADELFMKYMAGDKQTIMTGEIAGVPVKIKMDSFDGRRITDLKTVESLSKTFYAKDLDQRLNFIEWWGYDLQLAIYREIVRQNTGKTFPCYIAGISKQEHPRIAVIEIPQMLMDEKLIAVEENIGHIQALKNGEYEPIRCERCDYCADTAVLTRPISIDELWEDV